MSDDTTPTGGFAGDPAAALRVTGSGACCGSPAQAVCGILPPVGEADAAGPCCGTRQATQAATSCCGTQTRTDAVATGQGCCG